MLFITPRLYRASSRSSQVCVEYEHTVFIWNFLDAAQLCRLSLWERNREIRLQHQASQERAPLSSKYWTAFFWQHMLSASLSMALTGEPLHVPPVWCSKPDTEQEVPVSTTAKICQRNAANRITTAICFQAESNCPKSQVQLFQSKSLEQQPSD